MLKKIFVTVSTASLVACGGGGGDQTPPPAKPKVSVPQMSLSAVKGSVANPDSSATKALAGYAAMPLTDSFDARFNTTNCSSALSLFNIYSLGWSDKFKGGLTPKQILDMKGFYGISGANGIVDYSAYSKEMIEAKDWISYFYYGANFQDCEARRDKEYDSINKESNDITELRYQTHTKAEAKDNTPEQTRNNYTAWQIDKTNNTLVGLISNVTHFTKDGGKIKEQLKSYRWDTGRAVDSISIGDMFVNSYFLESIDNSTLDYQVVGGKVIDKYAKPKSTDIDQYYAVNLISAHFPGIGTQVNWCVRGSQFAKNKETPITAEKYKEIIDSGDLDTAYCDPFDAKVGQVRYYDTEGKKVTDSSSIATELKAKLASGNVVKDKLDELVNNKKLYLGKSQQEYYQDLSLSNQVDQIKVDLKP
ncbi:hypothetical protein HWV01_11280 [Moritella sp. 5]|uniref:hypothetical protein n=1 Tax=Moritella sp. 5 TaxID=2746231 RepID=UPI001BA98F5D|nr:hypothetical protein [Moritella sp. 5]QUM80819.1 hypothetical protein HWV01_11280 [Moritella sp. 5]